MFSFPRMSKLLYFHEEKKPGRCDVCKIHQAGIIHQRRYGRRVLSISRNWSTLFLCLPFRPVYRYLQKVAITFPPRLLLLCMILFPFVLLFRQTIFLFFVDVQVALPGSAWNCTANDWLFAHDAGLIRPKRRLRGGGENRKEENRKKKDSGMTDRAGRIKRIHQGVRRRGGLSDGRNVN